jgi:hypothetical protein
MPSAELVHSRGRKLARALTLLALVAAVVGAGTSDRALADGACGERTLRGSYLFVASGFNIFTNRQGAKIWMIQTNPSTVMEGTATRIARRGRTGED